MLIYAYGNSYKIIITSINLSSILGTFSFEADLLLLTRTERTAAISSGSQFAKIFSKIISVKIKGEVLLI